MWQRLRDSQCRSFRRTNGEESHPPHYYWRARTSACSGLADLLIPSLHKTETSGAAKPPTDIVTLFFLFLYITTFDQASLRPAFF